MDEIRRSRDVSVSEAGRRDAAQVPAVSQGREHDRRVDGDGSVWVVLDELPKCAMTRYGRLTFIRDVERPKFSRSNQQHCEYECACGKRKIIMRASVVNGQTRSCGCMAQKIQRDWIRVGVAEARRKRR
jgi:hypothetical protein